MLWFQDDTTDYPGCRTQDEGGGWRKRAKKCFTCGNYHHCRNCGLGVVLQNDHYKPVNEFDRNGKHKWICAEIQDDYTADGEPDDSEPIPVTITYTVPPPTEPRPGFTVESTPGSPLKPPPPPPNRSRRSGIDLRAVLEDSTLLTRADGRVSLVLGKKPATVLPDTSTTRESTPDDRPA